MELSQVVNQHILITIAITLAGLLIGGGLGIFTAWLLKLLFQTAPGLRPPLMLVPWRTILFGFVLVFCSPVAILVIRNIRPGGAMAGLYPGLAFLAIVFFFVSDGALNLWLPTGLSTRMAGLVRTLAVGCGVIVTIGLTNSGMGIMYYARLQIARTFDFGSMWIVVGVVMGMGLVFDLLLGIVQMLMIYAERKKARVKIA